MNYNKVLLAGHLTRDPELRQTKNGNAVANFGLATNKTIDRDRSETTFVEVTAWKRQAEVICEHFHKGSPIFLEGRLTLEEWNDQSGAKRSRLKVTLERFEFVGKKDEQGGGRSLDSMTKEIISQSQRAAAKQDIPF